MQGNLSGYKIDIVGAGGEIRSGTIKPVSYQDFRITVCRNGKHNQAVLRLDEMTGQFSIVGNSGNYIPVEFKDENK